MTIQKHLHLCVSGAATLLALNFGWGAFYAWVGRAVVPGARHMGDTWPAFLLVSLALLGLLCLAAPRERLGSFALVSIAWSLCVAALMRQPNFASATDLGSGPILRPLFAALFLGTGWLATGARLPRLGALLPCSVAERAVLVYVFFVTANGKLFARSAIPGFGLIDMAGLVAVALLVAESAQRGPTSIFGSAKRRLGSGPFWCLVGLPLWWFVAGLAADRDSAMFSAWRLGIACLVALVTIGVVGDRAKAFARQIFGVLMVGLLVVLLGGLLGVMEAAQFESLERVLGSRLRILGLHPNLGGALFAAGLPLALGWLLAKDSNARRWLGGLVVLGAGCALYLCDSRASAIGAAVGCVAFCLLYFTRFAERIGPRTFMGAALAGVLGIVLLISPLGSEVRAALDAKAMTQSALGQRWHIWRMSAAAIVDNPLFGLGPLGFNGHARYALESYYDGTSQSLHTHNIFLAAAEGAGWIGLLLFTLFVGGLAEVLRRAICLAKVGGRDRPMLVALFAGAFALLACNQLDLGQSQLTLVPLFFLAALMIAGLQRELPESEPNSKRGSAWKSVILTCFCLLAIWPSGGAILAGVTGMVESRKLGSQGKRAEARVRLERLDSVWIAVHEAELFFRMKTFIRTHEDLELELKVAADMVERLPNSSFPGRYLATALAMEGRFAKARVAIGQSIRVDPLGEFRGQASMIEAWIAFGTGHQVKAMDLLVDGLSGTFKVPARMHKTVDDSLRGVNIAALLDDIGTEIVAGAQDDPIRARRRIDGLARAFEHFEMRAAVLPYLRGVIGATQNPIRALVFNEIVLLHKLGRPEEARAVWQASPFRNEVNFREAFSELVEPGDELAGESGPVGEVLDVFFTAERLSHRYLLRAISFLEAGQTAKARHELDRALYNAQKLDLRVRHVATFIEASRAAGSAGDWEMTRYLERACGDAASARDKVAIEIVAGWLASSYGGRTQLLEAWEHRLGDFGLAGRNMRSILMEQP